jgi:hypothetical protein
MAKLPLDTLRKFDLSLDEMICSRLDFVHDFFLSFPYEVRDSLPSDGDLVVLVGKKDWARRIRELSRYRGRVVLVFAQGDVPVHHPPPQRSLPRNVVSAYATNNQFVDRRAVAVPLGVRINRLRPLRFVRQNLDRAEKGLLYGNFALNNRYYRPDRSGVPHIRKRLVEQMRNAPWATLDIAADHREEPADLIRYYVQTARHKFVLSPEGSGIDCYRTWEALYLGAIPIVVASPAMSAFSNLPILFTEDYSELSEKYLERRWHEFSRRVFEPDKALRSYYRCHFLTAVGMLRNPRFLCWKVDDSLSDRFIDAMRLSSLLAGSLAAETPRPPFAHAPDLMSPEAWHMPGEMRLTRSRSELRITVSGNDRTVAELPLKTIGGARFRLRGQVVAKGSRPAPLSVGIVERRETIAEVELGRKSSEPLCLDFVARSERAVISIRAPHAGPGSRWSVKDLRLDAVF